MLQKDDAYLIGIMVWYELQTSIDLFLSSIFTMAVDHCLLSAMTDDSLG